MTKEVINIHISEVLERIESVDRLINMYRKSADDVVAISMAKQHSIRKEEFVERLNQLRKKALKLEQTPVLKRTYSFEPLLASVAREGERPYGKKDNLTLIEGIGPKIEELINQAGISTFDGLAATSVTRLREILDTAGNRFQTHNPETWPQQAKLAAAGNWESLKKLQQAWN